MSDEKIRVAVLGAAGRMGTTVCRAVLDAPDMELVAVIDPPHEGRPLDDFGVTGTGLTLAMLGPAVKAAAPSVAVDFTQVDAARGPGRRGPGRDPHPLRPAPGAGGPPGGAARHDRPIAHHPPRLLRPDVVHARRPAGRPGGGQPPRPDRRPRHAPRVLTAQVPKI